MWKGCPVVFRVLTKRKRLVENRICSHCLSTTLPPSQAKDGGAVGMTGASHPSVLPTPRPSDFTHPRGLRYTASQNSGPMPPFGVADNQSIQVPSVLPTPRPSDFTHPSGLRHTASKNLGPIPPFGVADNQRNDVDVDRCRCSLQAPSGHVSMNFNEEAAFDGEFSGMSTDFPCATQKKVAGPEPDYDNILTGFKTFHSPHAFKTKYNKGVLPELQIAYETWGELNEARDNVVLISAGLSASSHAKSHEDNPKPGWWEKFVGPGLAIDTSKFFVVCTNTLGGCYGSTGPSSTNPLTGKQYGTNLPLVSVEDMVRAQFLLMDHLGVDKIHASVGSSLGGMLSLSSAVLFPERVQRVVSISSCAQSHPSSIAMRYLQRKAIMTDPNWQKGHYYDTGKYPRMGMKLAREIATMTYRSGPEWDERFGRKRIKEGSNPSLCPTFMIENYLDYQGESFCMRVDPNTLLYISKAMDLFDLGETFGSLHTALSRVKCPIMVVGVQTDILFPVWQQRALAKALQESGNEAVTYYELNSIYGHDTFLLDLNGVGSGVKGFLETAMRETGRAHTQKKEFNVELEENNSNVPKEDLSASVTNAF